MSQIIAFVLTLALSLVFTKIVLALPAHARWLLRAPTEDRWHKTITPAFGGIAMVGAFSIVLLLSGELHGNTLKVFVGGLLAFGLGLIDDFRPLPPYTKLVGQIAIACVLVILNVHALLTFNPLVYIPLTVLWIVGITNAFNLLDNMDGLAGGTAFISAAFLAWVSFSGGDVLSPVLIPAFLGAILGFLVFNIHPAKIFMGDCGSQWLGLTLALFTIVGSWESASNLFLMIVTPLLVLGVPIFDTMLVALNRKIHGRPVSKGGRDHTSHRLVALGMSERKTVWVLWGLSVLFGLVAVFAHIYQIETWILVAGGVLVFGIVFGMFLTDVKVYDRSPIPAGSGSRILWVTVFYKRRIVEILMDTVLIGGAYVLAYLLRYDWNLDPFLYRQLGETLPLVIGAKLVLFLAVGLYHGIWTYIDFDGVVRLLRSLAIASLGSVLVLVFLYRFEGFSRTLFAIDFIILFVLMGGSRALLRALRESVFAFPEKGTRILIVGAGDACRFLLHEIRRNRQWNLRPVAIVDDDRRKKGRKILDIPVLGARDMIPELVESQAVEKIIIAIPSLQEEDRLQIERRCAESGVPYASMQSLEKTLIREIMD